MLIAPISAIPSWLGDLGDVGEVLAGIAALVGLLALAVQIRALAIQTKELASQTKQEGQAIRASVIQGITTQMLAIDHVFVEHPQLRPFFYGKNVPLAEDHREYARALAVAEMLVDLIDCVVSLKDNMVEEIDLPGWYEYARALYEQSVPARAFLEANETWYSPETVEAMTGKSLTAPILPW